MPLPGWATLALLPHGQCYAWLSELIALHAIADLLIALAYFSIPLALVRFVRIRPDTPYPYLFWLFGGFIVACGATHLMEVVSIWQPYYWTSGWLKLGTAFVSVATAVVSIKVLPSAIRFRSPAEMEQANRELEERVQQRTLELAVANEKLKEEMAQRELAQNEVRRLNASLQQRLDEMQVLFDVLPVGVGIANKVDCSDIRINQRFSRMLGISKELNASLSAPEHERPRGFRVLHDGRELEPKDLPIQKAAAENREVRDFEEVIERADGISIDVLATAVPLRDEFGRARGAVACFLDITERKEAERRRQESRKLESLGILAGGLAHDFNNLLTGMLGNATLLAEMLPEHRVATPLLQEIETAAERAATLCRQMLAYAGKGRFLVRQIDLNHLVSEEQADLATRAGPGAALVLELAADLKPFKGDELQVRQVLQNLVHNSIEALPGARGHIRIRTSLTPLTLRDLQNLLQNDGARTGDYACLEVSDDGCGMDPQLVPHIFDPFFTTKFTGRGLGLAAVQGIVRAHRGALHVETAPGRGTTLRVYFPIPEEIPSGSYS